MSRCNKSNPYRKDNSLVFVPCAHCDKECDISKWILSHLQLGWRHRDDPLSTECAKDRSDLMFNLPLCPLSLDKVQSRVHHCINASTHQHLYLLLPMHLLHCNTLEVHTCGAVEGTLSRHTEVQTRPMAKRSIQPSCHRPIIIWMHLGSFSSHTFATTSSFMQIPPVALHFESFTCAWCPSCALLRPVTCNLQLFGLQGESEIQFAL